MGGILGDHIAHQSCVKRLARSFSGEARYLSVRLSFGLDVNKDTHAFLNCLGSVSDMEFTTANIRIIRMGKHHPVCKGQSEMLVVVRY